MKKLVTLILAMVLCVGFAVPAAAAYPETWDEAAEKMSLDTTLGDLQCIVEQEFSYYYESYDTSKGEYVSVKDSNGARYNIMPSDGTVTVTNTGSGNDYYVWIQVRAYEKESSKKYVARIENDSSAGYTLRKGGFVESWYIGTGENELVKLYAGQSTTITASDLLGLPGIDPNKEYMFRVTLYQDYPSVEKNWYASWAFSIDDDAAAKVIAKGRADDPGNPFMDVEKEDYYHDAVVWALKKDITTGMSITEFSPFSTCTRGQVATFLWRAKGCPEPKTTENPFTDIQESDYYYKAILWAYENGITTGATETTFDPNGTCTSAHVVTFLWRSNGEPSADFTGTEYYAEAVAWAEKEGLLDGTATPFAPNSLSPRADIVTYLYRDMG